MKAKHVTIAYGRFNPPTIGHEKLIKEVMKHSKGGDWFIIPSFKVEKGINPLPYEYKVDLMEEMFPFAKGHIDKDACCQTLFIAMSYMSEKGYTDLTFVAGQDRVSDYTKKFAPVEEGGYNGKMNVARPFSFTTVKVVNAGFRDPDADGAEGMSASKLRAAAVAGNTREFMKGLPNTLSASYKVAVMNKVLENM